MKRPSSSSVGRPHRSLAGFLPPVARWFSKAFDAPSPAQKMAWPAIHRGENTLLLAPTGSGKTFAAFLCAIDDLYRRGSAGDLSDGVQVLYISPLKALGNDVHRNLLVPLAGIREDADAPLPEIRTAVRTGDTPQSERAQMVRRPPHILITTPESLYLLLGSTRMRAHLRTVRTVIVDEVHALCDSKRGVHLAVSLERLAACVDVSFQRIGCSATLAPLDEIARFLVGRGPDGADRPCTLVDAGSRKGFDVEAVAPLPDFFEADGAALWSSAYELLAKEIADHRTTLIFCNSRHKAERTALQLTEAVGNASRVGVHHGSMSREVRLEAEDALKAGELDAMVATASLELGIDIGSVDLVYQLESPKSVATGLQRIGRAGHLLDEVSKGRVLIFQRDELLEAAVVCRGMLDGKVDAVHLLRNCLDVLAQQVAGAVAVHDWQANDLLDLLRRAYPYWDLSGSDFEAVLGMLAGERPFEMDRAPRPLILWDRASGRLSAARGSASITAMCVGTIPETSEYDVVIEGTRKYVGRLQSDFVDGRLRIGDIFVLGSSAWKLIGARRNRLFVQPASGETPTVPRWSGRIEARTVEVGTAVGALRGEVASRLDDPKVAHWLASEYRLCPNSAAALVEYIREQKLAAGFVPDHERLLVEVWRDELGETNLILHSPYGERINRAWGLVLASAGASMFGFSWSVTPTNDLVVLTSDGGPEERFSAADTQALFGSVDPDNVAGTVRGAAQEEGVLSSSFKDVAVCALQILNVWQGKRVPFWLQSYRAAELFEASYRHTRYPVVSEVLRTYLEESLDVPGLTDLLRKTASQAITLTCQDVESPSPFCHAVLSRHLVRRDDRMGRDHRAHLLRLHRKVLEQVLSDEQMAGLLDPRAIEHLEQRRLHRAPGARARTSEELLQAIRDLGDPPAALDAIGQMVDGNATGLLGPLAAERRVVAIELPDNAESPIRLVTADLWREHCDAYGLQPRGQRGSVRVPKIQEGEIVGFDRAPPSRIIPTRWRKRLDPQTARRAVLERYLRCRGPVSAYEVMNHTGWSLDVAEHMLNGLVDSGIAARGVYTCAKPGPQWVNRTNLEEIHRRTLGYLKRELAPCEPPEVVDFMVRWQHLHPASRLGGIDGLRAAIRQLQGFEVVSGVLEPDLLRYRVADYGPHLLEQLIASGEVRWLRVGDGVSRGRLSLCLAEDAQSLGCGVQRIFDVEGEADADIAETILRVRDHFRSNPNAFFDEVVSETRGDQGAVLRAVWYLAWCGELTCLTYECLRHAGLRSVLSACYDTASTPGDILAGRLSSERVVDRLRERRMDPRLGPWMATDRLLGSATPLERAEVVRRWARQLLDRWGIVTRDLVAHEGAAPPWAELDPEFKRLELTGIATRGFFIESHYGVQYGLPDALELLRDCRGRRGGGTDLAGTQGDPFVGLSPHDPANLYTSCLEVIQENGVRLRSARLRAAHRPTVVQAGRPVLHAGHQVEALTRAQLRDCIDALRWTPSREEARTAFRTWNGRPIDSSPAADLLWEMGFRFDRPDLMAWPPHRDAGRRPRVPHQEVFLPHYLEPSPVTDEPDSEVPGAPENVPLDEASEGSDAIAINRAPVLTLWGAVVAQRLGHDWEAALTLGRCLSGLNAQTKGRRLGIYAAPQGVEGGAPPEKAGLGEEFWIRICGRPLPAKRTVRGVRAVTGDRAIAPRSVENYLRSRFGDHFDDAKDLMVELSESYSPDLLEQSAWELYVQFRPRIPDGIEGWGARGALDLGLLRSLARGPV